jgi:hypothetical protein
MQIKDLKKQKEDVLNRIHFLHESGMDPDMRAVYLSDLQYHLVKIEAAIEHEKYMLPFKLTLVGFVIAVLGLIIYSI